MTEYKIALVGFGGVNRGLAQLVAERNARWQASLGFSVRSFAKSGEAGEPIHGAKCCQRAKGRTVSEYRDR